MSDVEERNESLVLVGEKSFDGGIVEVHCTEDKLKLFVSVRPTTPNTAVTTSVNALATLVQEIAPGSDPDKSVLESIVAVVARGEEALKRRVARGDATTPGRDGRVVLLVKQFCPPGDKQCTEMVDSRFIKAFDNIEKGTPVGRVMPPTYGKAGRDVFGVEIPAPLGKAAEAMVDETIAIEKQTGADNLVAQVSGYITTKAGKLTIVSKLVIEGDVSFRTGDIDFIGSVMVRGDVQRDFSVTAGESIEVSGNVAHGKLHSHRGDIIVKGYVLGDAMTGFVVGENTNEQMLQSLIQAKESQIMCAGAFHASILDGAAVEALGDIVIKKEARNSSLRTRAQISAVSARVYGGDLYAVCGLEVQELGNAAGAATLVHACSDIESSAEYATLSDRIRGYLSAEQMLEMQLGPLVKDPQQLARLSPAHRTNVLQSLKKLQDIRTARTGLEAKRSELLQSATRNEHFRVNVLRKLYPGVTVVSGEQQFSVAEELAGPKTIEHNPETGEFSVTALQPLVCDASKKEKSAA